MNQQRAFQLHWSIRFLILILILILTVVAAIVMVVPQWDLFRLLVVSGLALFLIPLTLALLNPEQFGWCWRVVVGMLCVGMVLFSGVQLLSGAPWYAGLSFASLTMAFGVPGIMFAIRGRLPILSAGTQANSPSERG